MAEVLTFDPTPSAEVISSIEADQAESLAIGEELMAQQEGLLAGKYKNAQELEQAYVELQRKLGGKEEDSFDEEYSEAEEQDDLEENSEDDIDSQVDLLFRANDEFQATGELSQETLEAFSQMSSQELVEAYVRMQSQNQQEMQPQGVSLSDGEINAIKNSVGGEAAYNTLTSWAAENFSPAEIQAFDSVVESGNTAAINLALQALYYRYTDAMGYEGETIQGKPARSNDSFRSQAELVRAMSDPRYDSDPAYRQDVMEKLERSDLEF